MVPTAHEFRPHSFAPAGYLLHDWRCTCGARARRRVRSRLLAELDWWSDHVFPDTAPPNHTCTLVPGRYDNAITWECSCGAAGAPHGFADERRAWQSHRRHEHEEARLFYMDVLRGLLDSLSEQEYDAYHRARLNQRHAMDEETRHRPLHPDIAKAILDQLI